VRALFVAVDRFNSVSVSQRFLIFAHFRSTAEPNLPKVEIIRPKTTSPKAKTKVMTKRTARSARDERRVLWLFGSGSPDSKEPEEFSERQTKARILAENSRRDLSGRS
jgi:hypothetical protein